MSLNVTDPEEMIGPAVRGTTSILQSAVKNRASVKRVICVSTTAALFSPAVGSGPVTERIIDERDWNEISVPHVREKGTSQLLGHVLDVLRTECRSGQ